MSKNGTKEAPSKPGKPNKKTRGRSRRYQLQDDAEVMEWVKNFRAAHEAEHGFPITEDQGVRAWVSAAKKGKL